MDTYTVNAKRMLLQQWLLSLWLTAFRNVMPTLSAIDTLETPPAEVRRRFSLIRTTAVSTQGVIVLVRCFKPRHCRYRDLLQQRSHHDTIQHQSTMSHCIDLSDTKRQENVSKTYNTNKIFNGMKEQHSSLAPLYHSTEFLIYYLYCVSIN